MAPGSADPEPEVPAAAALFRVRVPADAEIWFSGQETTQRGPYRLFVTPQMEAATRERKLKGWASAVRRLLA